MQRTNIYLDEGLAGRTRDLTVDLARIEASFGVADVEVPDRSPGAREEHLDQGRGARSVILLDSDIVIAHLPGRRTRAGVVAGSARPPFQA